MDGAVGGLAIAIGPLVGGAVVEGASWQWIFWLNVPIGVALLPIARLRLTESRGPSTSLDLPGVVLASLGLLGIVLGVVRGNDHGWTSATVLPAIVIGVRPVNMPNSGRCVAATTAAARTMGACMTVSFQLSPEQEQLKLGARQFAEEHLRPLAAGVRKEPDPLRRALLARPVFEKAVAAGFLKGLIPAPFGGAAAGGIEACILIEEWACHSPDFVISLAGPLIALAPVYEAGTPEQIQRFVAPFLASHGAPVAAMAFSEPEGTANFAAPPPAEGLRTTAVPDGDSWIVNGRKAWASHLAGWDGNGPDVMTIVCRAPGGVSVIVAEREHLAGHIEVEEHYDLAGLRGCMTSRIRLHDVRVPRSNILGAEGQGAQLTYNAFWASGASIGIFAVAAMRQAFDVAYHYALTEKRGGALPIIEHQSVADVLADAKSRIEAVRLLTWRALDAVIAQDAAGPELALHAKIFGSETGVEVISRLMNVVGVQAYDNNFPLMANLSQALAYPVIEGSNTGIRRRQLQDLFRTPGYNPLSASGMA